MPDFTSLDNNELMQLLRNSNVPLRRPSWTQPTFWSRPLIRTIMIPVEASSSWSTILAVSGLNGYSAVVTGYVATPLGDASLSQVRFRFVYQGRLVSSMSLGASAFEHNRESPTLFPTFPQSTAFICERVDTTLSIQAINDGVFQQPVLCAFYGYYYDNMNQAEKSDIEGVTDVS